MEPSSSAFQEAPISIQPPSFSFSSQNTNNDRKQYWLTAVLFILCVAFGGVIVYLLVNMNQPHDDRNEINKDNEESQHGSEEEKETQSNSPNECDEQICDCGTEIEDTSTWKRYRNNGGYSIKFPSNIDAPSDQYGAGSTEATSAENLIEVQFSKSPSRPLTPQISNSLWLEISYRTKTLKHIRPRNLLT